MSRFSHKIKLIISKLTKKAKKLGNGTIKKDDKIIEANKTNILNKSDHQTVYPTRSIQSDEGIIRNDKKSKNKITIEVNETNILNKNDQTVYPTRSIQSDDNNKYGEMVRNDKKSKNKITVEANETNILNKNDQTVYPIIIHKKSKNKIMPETYLTESIQRNEEKIAKMNNKYAEMIRDDKKNQIDLPKPISQRLMYGSCLSCHKVLDVEDWCRVCETRKFEQNFKNWTSGYSKIDQLIQESQLNAIDGLDYLEWIDYKEIIDIEYITRGGFGKIFKGVWTKGPKHRLNGAGQAWKNVPNITVALKEIMNIDWKNISNKSENASQEMNKDEIELNEFLKEVQNHQKFLRNEENHVLRCFGITKSPGDDIEIAKWLKSDVDRDSYSKKRPKPNSYIMVMTWANDGNLRNYIENKAHDKKFTWYRRLEILEELSGALDIIHNKNMVHKDLHYGNILMDDNDIFQFPAISDLGLCGNYNKNEIPIGSIPFIAPEHLKENPVPFTTASDIYSFGIIMWVICYCKLPHKKYKHNPLELTLGIVEGCRPEISRDIPVTYLDLMKRCWDDDLKKRPKASELRTRFLEWKNLYHLNNSEFLIAEKERLNRIKNPDLFDISEYQIPYKKDSENNFSPSNIYEEFEKIDFKNVEII